MSTGSLLEYGRVSAPNPSASPYAPDFRRLIHDDLGPLQPIPAAAPIGASLRARVLDGAQTPRRPGPNLSVPGVASSFEHAPGEPMSAESYFTRRLGTAFSPITVLQRAGTHDPRQAHRVSVAVELAYWNEYARLLVHPLLRAALAVATECAGEGILAALDFARGEILDALSVSAALRARDQEIIRWSALAQQQRLDPYVEMLGEFTLDYLTWQRAAEADIRQAARRAAPREAIGLVLQRGERAGLLVSDRIMKYLLVSSSGSAKPSSRRARPSVEGGILATFFART